MVDAGTDLLVGSGARRHRGLVAGVEPPTLNVTVRFHGACVTSQGRDSPQVRRAEIRSVVGRGGEGAGVADVKDLPHLAHHLHLARGHLAHAQVGHVGDVVLDEVLVVALIVVKGVADDGGHVVDVLRLGRPQGQDPAAAVGRAVGGQRLQRRVEHTIRFQTLYDVGDARRRVDAKGGRRRRWRPGVGADRVGVDRGPVGQRRAARRAVAQDVDEVEDAARLHQVLDGHVLGVAGTQVVDNEGVGQDVAGLHLAVGLAELADAQVALGQHQVLAVVDVVGPLGVN